MQSYNDADIKMRFSARTIQEYFQLLQLLTREHPFGRNTALLVIEFVENGLLKFNYRNTKVDSKFRVKIIHSVANYIKVSKLP